MRTIDWDTDRDCVVMVDQTKLPAEYTTFHAETVPDDVGVYNPAFDPTPMELVDYLVTETGSYRIARRMPRGLTPRYFTNRRSTPRTSMPGNRRRRRDTDCY